jgi:hypothetical protein
MGDGSLGSEGRQALSPLRRAEGATADPRAGDGRAAVYEGLRLLPVSGNDDRALEDVAASGAGKRLGCLAEALGLV